MARVFGGVLGNFKGKLGKVAARIVSGDTILSARPSSFKESTTAKHAEVKQKFAVTIAFASAISDLPTLYEIWKLKKNPGMSVINTIFKRNYDFSSVELPTLQNIITPDGFGSPVTAAAVAAGKLTSTLTALETVAVISDNDVDLSINAVICLSDPKTASDSSYKILPVSKEIAGFNFNQEYNLEINLNVEDTAEVAKYNQKLVFLSVAIKSADGQISKYSRSHAIQSN
jgi:hypothetical protein